MVQNKIKPKVLVLLAAYNGRQFIEEQLETILQQKNINITVFLSVDLSTDSTYEWCKQLETIHQNVIVLEYGERFGGAAKNFYRLVCEVDFSMFEYISFADQDDIWDLDKLSHGIYELELANAEAYSANVIAFWDDGREKLIDKSQPQKQFDYLLEAAGPGCTYILTKRATTLVREYLNTYPELNDFVLHDWLFYAILRHNNYMWIIDSVPKMRYRQHNANQVGANSSFKGMVYRIKYVLSEQVFSCMCMLTKVLDISSVPFSSRMNILKLAFKARQLRRRKIDQVLVFIALLFHAVKGVKL